MTKEEIVKQFIASYEPDTFIKNEHGTLMYYSQNGVSGINIKCFFEDLVEHVLDQQTSELKAELFKATQTAKSTSVTQRQHIERLQNELNELKEKYYNAIKTVKALSKENNEIKEKHKRDVESSFRDGLFRPKLYMNNAELYYKQKFESNDNN